MSRASLLFSLLALSACAPKTPVAPAADADPAAHLADRGDVVDTLHGVQVADPYRWLEDADTDAVASWTEQQNQNFEQHTDGLSQREDLYARFQHLWRYDDRSTPEPCLLSPQVVYKTKSADQDKWVVHMLEDEMGDGRVVLDPNTWEETETLAFFTPSPDCRYAAVGKAKAGDENPVTRVLDLETLEYTDDALTGWKHSGVAWKHDNSGFYFSGKPLAGTVPEGDEFYFHRVWFHPLGTTGDADELVLFDDEVKEHYHAVWLSEDGRWLTHGRFRFSQSAIWLEDLQAGTEPVPVVTDMEDETIAEVVADKLVITTNRGAPNKRLMWAPLDTPGVENWQELVPESEAVLSYASPIGGQLYLSYKDKASTRIAVHQLDGAHMQDVQLPTVGSARVWGFWSRPRVWLSFTSYASPRSIHLYDVKENALELYKESPIDIDPTGIVVEQVFYPSKDGTPISMFLVRNEDAPQDGSVPVLLNGYGGFDVSLTPYFSTTYAVWVQAGGMVAVPNLRGGGEYGREWHEAGMRDKKQNVFDDFIAAAEWLIDEGWTSSEHLAISGGSNGGLLVSAVVTQRPELYKAVLCQVPLTDMVRFHTFGLANIWTEEYGSADDPEMFPHIHAYSPYHNTVEGTDYPAILVTGSENDARTDPAHARKFYAAVQHADADHGLEEPILLHVQGESGHGGGVTIDTKADQVSRSYGFLMDQVGLPTAAGSIGPAE